jgi:hypothetical protein
MPEFFPVDEQSPAGQGGFPGEFDILDFNDIELKPHDDLLLRCVS